MTRPSATHSSGVDIGGSRVATALVAVTRDLRVAAVEVYLGDESVLQRQTRSAASPAPMRSQAAANDPWRFQGEALRLVRDGIGPMMAWRQPHARMVPGSERLHAAIVQQRRCADVGVSAVA